MQRKLLLDIRVQAHPGSKKEELSSRLFIEVSFSSKRYLYGYILASIKTGEEGITERKKLIHK